MEIKIDLDMQSIIAATISAEKIQPLFEKAILDALKSAINDATGYRSKFSEELKRQLSEAMPHGLSIDDVAKFQYMMNAAVTAATHGENAKTINEAMRRATAAVLPEAPTRIKLSQLLEDARGAFHKEDNEAFYAHMELSEYGGGWLYIDESDATKEKYRADIRISFNKEGEVYSLKLDGIDITPKSLPNAVGSFDGLLLSMYVGRTSIEIDLDESGVEYAAQDKID
jgi:hypothetical protein